jgi:AAHS family 4-hydroxybenzoate transporter-like MFS transporter
MFAAISPFDGPAFGAPLPEASGARALGEARVDLAFAFRDGATRVAGAVATVLTGFAVSDQSQLLAAMLLTGACTNGAQAGLNALAADIYPTELRATGIGWALGVGRIGAILGPLAGGVLIAAGLAPGYLLAMAAAPVLVAGLAVILLGAGWRSAA